MLELLLATPEVKPQLCSEDFSVDGALLWAWTSPSSLERIGRTDDDLTPPSGGKGFGSSASASKKRALAEAEGRAWWSHWGDFRVLLLSSQTHRSSSDGETRLFKQAPEVDAFLSFIRQVTQASGTCERNSALRMARSFSGAHQKTLGADKGYDERDFVADLRISGITPHVAQNIQPRRRSAIDGRTVRHEGYAQSINARKRIEQVFAWIKQAVGLGQLKPRGRSKVGAVFRLHVAAFKLIHITNLLRT